MSEAQIIYVPEDPAAVKVLLTSDPATVTTLESTGVGPQGPQGIPGSATVPESGVITRNLDGSIAQVALETKTVVLTRIGDVLSSVTDGTYTWTFTRDVNGALLSWTVA